jgi:hypothetical protein
VKPEGYARTLQLAKQLLQQREAMQRNALTPTEWLAFRLGCSYEKAEKLVEQVKAEART